MIEYEFVTWDFVDKTVDQVVSELARRDLSFSGVYALPKGGLVLGTMLSYRMKIPLLAHADKDCFIVDDIADTGESLLHFKKTHFIVTLYYHKQSLVVPNLWFKEKIDKWVVFPWENQKDPE